MSLAGRVACRIGRFARLGRGLLRVGVVALLAAQAQAQTPAQASLDGIRTRLAEPAVLRGTFVQEKRLAGFRNALKSEGRFLIARGKGVAWDTLSPFASGTVVTRDRILSRAADGSTRVEVDATRQPGLVAVNGLLFAVLAGDVAALSQQFDMQAELTGDSGWTLVLSPRVGGAGEVIARIDLEGDRHVRRVRIEERGGDVTAIAFGELSETPALLSDAEARQFE